LSVDTSNKEHVNKELQIFTLGRFEVVLNGIPISPKQWGRDKTLQLFQYFIATRHKRALHKEQIIDGLWPEVNGAAGDRDFKVALHGINKTLEPNRENRSDPKFTIRQGLTYQLNWDKIWLDIDVMEAEIEKGQNTLNPNKSIEILSAAVKHYQGPFIPSRLYEDWSSAERERIQVIALGAMISLAEKTLDVSPMESVRLCTNALNIDHTWEDAYRIKMEAYFKNGNRPQVIKTYAECERVLDEEFGISPLPRTKQVLKKVESA